MKTGDRPAQKPAKARCVHRMLEGQCAICADLAPRDAAKASTTTATAGPTRPATAPKPPPAPMRDRIRAASESAEQRRAAMAATARTTTAMASTTTAKPKAPILVDGAADIPAGVKPDREVKVIMHTPAETPDGTDGADACKRCGLRPATVPGPRSAIHAPPVATKSEADAEALAERECAKFCTTCRGNATQKAKDRIAGKEGVDKKTRRPRNPRWSEVAAVLAEPYQPMASRPVRKGALPSPAAVRKVMDRLGGRPAPTEKKAIEVIRALGDAQAAAVPSTPAPSDSSLPESHPLDQGATAPAPVLHAKGEDTRVLCRSVGRAKIAPANEVTCADCLALLKVEAEPGQVMTVGLDEGALALSEAGDVGIRSWKPGTRFLDGDQCLWVRTATGAEWTAPDGARVEFSERDLERVELAHGPFRLHTMTDEEEDRKLEAFLADCSHPTVPDDGTGEGFGCCPDCGSVTEATAAPRLRKVIVESPYKSGDLLMNEAYARRAMADCLRRGEAPFASHLLYTQPGVLRDEVEEERALGIEAGLVWGTEADATVVYTDLGVSGGMTVGIERANAEGRPVEMRQLPAEDFEAARADRDLAMGGPEAKRKLDFANAQLREVEEIGFGVRHDPDADPHGGATWVAFIKGVTEVAGETPHAAARALRDRLAREWTSSDHTEARIRSIEEMVERLKRANEPPISSTGFDFENVVAFFLRSGIYGRTWEEMRKILLEEKLRELAVSTGFV